MKSQLLIAAVAVLLFLPAASPAADLTFTGAGRPASTVTGTYADDQVDTLTYTREGVESTLYFFVNPADSISVTDVIVRRMFGSELLAVQAGDTIIGATANETGAIIQAAITLTPLCDKLQFFVTYASTGNGISSPTVIYGVQKNR